MSGADIFEPLPLLQKIGTLRRNNVGVSYSNGLITANADDNGISRNLRHWYQLELASGHPLIVSLEDDQTTSKSGPLYVEICSEIDLARCVGSDPLKFQVRRTNDSRPPIRTVLVFHLKIRPRRWQIERDHITREVVLRAKKKALPAILHFVQERLVWQYCWNLDKNLLCFNISSDRRHPPGERH